ncbi:MAG: hypothetical protein J0I06_05490 [Planctomycetes bacterium]|nr:hypothetical protein [Planctomycetota bacterium]
MTTNFRHSFLAALALGLGAVVGCGGPPKAHVKGTVTIDGKPLADGVIEFFPVGGSGQSAGTAIKDGAYELDASVGEMKVSVHGVEVIGKQKAYDTPDSPMIDTVRNPVPARYNTRSELKKTLVAGPNEVNLELTSDKKK